MPRSRAALTDKEERILIQAQLMGLSTQSMVKIGNRLKALEKERDDINRIAEQTEGYVWDENPTADRIKFSAPDGTTVEAVRGKKGRSHWGHYSWGYTITVNKPGTRFKPRVYKDVDITCDYDWTKRLMPAKSKELYSVIRWHRNSMKWCKHEDS